MFTEMATKKLKRKTLRSVLSFLLAVILIGGITYLGIKTYQASHAASSPTVYLNPGTGTFTTGSTVSVTIRENSGSDPVNSVQVSLKYNSDALQFSSIVEGGAFPVIAATSTGSPGIVRVGRANATTPQVGDQAVATVNFKVIGASGSGDIVIDKAYSMLVRSTDNKDIMQTAVDGKYTLAGSSTPSSPGQDGGTATPSPISPTGKPLFYVSPANGTYGTGSTISAAIRLNSSSVKTTTAQAVISYPADKLQYVSVTEGGVYTTQMRTKNTSGSLDIIRGIAGGGEGKTGDNLVVTVNFKVLASSGTANLAIANGSAVYDASGSGANILDAVSSAGASYTLATAGTASPPPPPSSSNGVGAGGSKGNGKQTIKTPSKGLEITVGPKGSAALGTKQGESVTELKGEVTLAPAVTTASDGVSGISKVEYYLDKKLISTQKSSPYNYNFDTKKIRNGVHELTVKTYFNNGTVDTKVEKLLVKNKITPAYVVRQYATSALALVAILAVCMFVMWKLVIPHFAFARGKQAVPTADHDLAFGAGVTAEANKLVSEDPVIVTPTSNDVSSSAPAAGTPSVQVDTAAQTTPSLIAPAEKIEEPAAAAEQPSEPPTTTDAPTAPAAETVVEPTQPEAAPESPAETPAPAIEAPTAETTPEVVEPSPVAPEEPADSNQTPPKPQS